MSLKVNTKVNKNCGELFPEAGKRLFYGTGYSTAEEA